MRLFEKILGFGGESGKGKGKRGRADEVQVQYFERTLNDHLTDAINVYKSENNNQIPSYDYLRGSLKPLRFSQDDYNQALERMGIEIDPRKAFLSLEELRFTYYPSEGKKEPTSDSVRKLLEELFDTDYTADYTAVIAHVRYVIGQLERLGIAELKLKKGRTVDIKTLRSAFAEAAKSTDWGDEYRAARISPHLVKKNTKEVVERYFGV